MIAHIIDTFVLLILCYCYFSTNIDEYVKCIRKLPTLPPGLYSPIGMDNPADIVELHEVQVQNRKKHLPCLIPLPMPKSIHFDPSNAIHQMQSVKRSVEALELTKCWVCWADNFIYIYKRFGEMAR